MKRSQRLAWTGLVLSAAFASAGPSVAGEPTRVASVSSVTPNDNRVPGGDLRDGLLTMALRAAIGEWQPEGPAGPTLRVEALGELGKTLTVPAPLIRVVEGTAIAVSVRNDLDAELVVHGLCTRDGGACPPLTVPARETRDVRFPSGPAGTYHYWGSVMGAPVPFREMGGAFVVDPAGTPAEPDRILVITEWSNLTAGQLRQIITADAPTEAFVGMKPRILFVMNGLSWPATERFAYELGTRVRWRVINLSSQPHPLHLHGFYFAVNSLGNGMRDATAGGDAPLVVTQLLPPSGTMTMTWTPEQIGNWLFHCHVMHHVSPERRLDGAGAHAPHGAVAHAPHRGVHDAAAGMAGMVIGVTVRDRATAKAKPSAERGAPRKLTLLMRRAPSGEIPSSGFILRDDRPPAATGSLTSPGPAIILRRNEPVEITLVNELDEPSAIHWHGMELESYYDGVHAFSGVNRRLTPMIAPGSSFVVRFTPPRAGTFIYHTHLHDYRQLTAGLYGPLLVLDDGETFDPAREHVVVLGRAGLTSDEPSVLTDPASVVINGQRAPRIVMNGGGRHRVRLINITPDDIFSVALQTADGPVTWTPVAKDGAPLARSRSVPTSARQTIAVGETYDFEYDAPEGRRTLWLEVRTPGGKWQAQAQVLVR